MDAERFELIEKVNAHRFNDTQSRRRFMRNVVLAAGGAAGVSAATAGPALADSVTTIINTAITAEALAVTYLGAVLAGAYAKPSTATDKLVATVLQAARAEEQAHYQYLAGLGAKALTLTFTVPASANPASATSALQTIAAAEGLFVNAYLAATNQFASAGNFGAATVAASILGVEAEHRALARAALVIGGNASFSPPNNVAFEPAALGSVSAVGAQLQQLGFIGGTGTQATYPGPGTIVSTGVTGTTPPSLTPQSGQGGAPGLPNTGAPAIAGGLDLPSAAAGLAIGGGLAAMALRLRRHRETGEL